MTRPKAKPMTAVEEAEWLVSMKRECLIAQLRDGVALTSLRTVVEAICEAELSLERMKLEAYLAGDDDDQMLRVVA